MPAILIVLCGLMVLGIGSSVVVGAWISAGLQALLLVGIASGKEGARKLLILLSLISIGVLSTFILLPLISLFDRMFISKASFRPDPLDGLVVVMTYALVPSLFTIFALTRRNVQTWMYARSMGNLEGVSSKRPDELGQATAAAVGSAGRPLFIVAGLLLCSALGLHGYARTVDIAADDTDALLTGGDGYAPGCGQRPDPEAKDQWGRAVTDKAQREEQLAAWLRCVELTKGKLEDPVATRASAKKLRLAAIALGVLAIGSAGGGVLRQRKIRAKLEAPDSRAPKS